MSVICQSRLWILTYFGTNKNKNCGIQIQGNSQVPKFANELKNIAEHTQKKAKLWNKTVSFRVIY